MARDTRDSDERERGGRPAARSERSGGSDPRSGARGERSSKPSNPKSGLSAGGLIRPPLVDDASAGRRASPSRVSNPRGSNSAPNGTLARMHASRTSNPRRDNGRENAPADRSSGSSRRSMGTLARDFSRSMSRSLSELGVNVGRSVGRAVRDAGRYEPPARGYSSARIEVPPEIAAQIASQPYRRSRARMLARKWRLGRVRSSPIPFAIGIAIATIIVLLVGVGGGAGGIYGVNYYNNHQTQIQNIYNLRFGTSTQIYDRNGKILYTARRDEGFNIYLPLAQINEKIRLATIDTEDHSFYSNIGVDFYGTLRSALVDASAGGAANQGGSTITQQLVKNIVAKDGSKTLQRKLNEMVLAYGVNLNYNKNQILEMYLNTIDYGDQNQGIEAAARNYFGLQPQTIDGKYVLANEQLTWAEAALLAGLPNAPSYYLPIQYSCDSGPCQESQWDNPCTGNPHNATCTPSASYRWQKNGHEWLDYRRALVILGNLLQFGDMTHAEYDQAVRDVHDILVGQKVEHWSAIKSDNTFDTTKIAPHFVDYIREELASEFGIDNPDQAGLRVYTTLDYNLDKLAQDRLHYYIQEKHDIAWKPYCPGGVCTNVPPLADSANAHNGALVALDPHTGDVLAMVGSVDYGNKDVRIAGSVNITTSNRSMGSSVKGIVYATAFQMGWNPATMLQDQPICYDNEQPLIKDPGKPDDGQKTHDDDAPACDGWYIPHNYTEHSYSGAAPIRVMLANSLNIPATEALSFVGGTADTSANIMSMAQRLGVTTWKANAVGPTTALGTQVMPLIELTSAYATFANQGKRAPYRSILRIEASDGTVLYQAKPSPDTQQVISPQSAFMLSSVLSDNEARAADFGRDNPLNFPNFPVAAKTGTSSGLHGPADIVTMGYTPYLALGVWMGNSDGSDMNAHIAGIAGAGYVFHDVMQYAIDTYKWPKMTGFPVPDKMARGQFNCTTGLAPYLNDPVHECPLVPLKAGSTPLYIGFSGCDCLDKRVDEDWYISGQAPLQS